MAYEYKIYWTDEAVNNLESILDHLQTKWTQREIDHFKKQLSKLLRLIAVNPTLFPKSDYNPRLRKAVLNKHTTIFTSFLGLPLI